jgi:hypothetical protein
MLALALAAALACPPAAPCRAVVTVTDRTTWVSPQRFPSWSAVRLRLWAGRAEMTSEPISGCAAYFYGHGVSVRVTTCGKRAPIRLVASSSAPHRVKLRLRYTAG